MTQESPPDCPPAGHLTRQLWSGAPDMISEIYGQYIKQFIRIVENIMKHASELQVTAMHDAFRKSYEYEKAFFSEALDVNLD
ncbi:MAG TPA: hypothetical protein VJ946_15175 [Bacteroidales bacterium]|nr:hypothetical protein [Bacteroidales bacterium]